LRTEIASVPVSALSHEVDDIVYSVGDFAVDTGLIIRQASREIATLTAVSTCKSFLLSNRFPLKVEVILIPIVRIPDK